MIKKSIQFGSKKIDYLIEYADRKSMGITVTPELSVMVRVPYHASLQLITTILQRRAPWILKQQDYFLTFHPKQPPKRFIGGETHLYLGKQYRLKVRKGRSESVGLRGPFFEVTTRKLSNVKDLLTDWYWYHAELKFEDILEEHLPRFKKMGVSPSAIRLRQMPKRWGSCAPNGQIILNPELIKAPRMCIEYVIIHELCHLIHRNHDRKFLQVQSRMMPDWEDWKSRLERMLA